MSILSQKNIDHPIKQHVLDVLSYTDFVRFSELKVSKVNSNTMSYHLKQLIEAGYICKTSDGYTLGANGLSFMNKRAASSSSPTMIVMLLVQNSDGDILLKKQDRQPYIGTWTMPFSVVHMKDASIENAAQRSARTLRIANTIDLRHVGDCYIRVQMSEVALTTSFIHLFRAEADIEPLGELYLWAEPRELGTYQLAPAIEQVIARAFFGDEYFFAEFNHEWQITK